MHSNPQKVPAKKRPHESLEDDTSIEEPPWKRVKPPFNSWEEAQTVYWDSLSKLSLTRRALRELDRRNKAAASEPTAYRPTAHSTLPKYPSNDLKRFARHGGPDLSDLIGVRLVSLHQLNPADMRQCNSYMERRPSVRFSAPHDSIESPPRTPPPDFAERSSQNTSHRKSSAYHGDFGQHLADYGIYMIDDEKEPTNWDDIQERLRQPRPSLSPSKFTVQAFKDFKKTNMEATTETKVMRSSFATIAGRSDIYSSGDVPFGNLAPLTNGALVDAKPDFFDGARPAQLDAQIRADLDPYIVPSKAKQNPLLPNFFAEGKGPNGSSAVLQRQACYDGALGARGLHELKTYRSEQPKTTYDEKADTITATYHADGSLKLYTTHIAPSASGKPEYHMNALGRWYVINSRDEFATAVGIFRNARDWAREQRDEIITAANSRISDAPAQAINLGSSGNSTASRSTDVPPHDSATSAEQPEDPLAVANPPVPRKRVNRGVDKKAPRFDPARRPPKKGSG
ncbi:MAG: hypothetical protein Q9222_003186 [Ikaeria aurantiellina]